MEIIAESFNEKELDYLKEKLNRYKKNCDQWLSAYRIRKNPDPNHNQYQSNADIDIPQLCKTISELLEAAKNEPQKVTFVAQIDELSKCLTQLSVKSSERLLDLGVIIDVA